MSSDPFTTPPQESGGQSSGSNPVVIIAVVLGVCLLMALICGGVLLALLVPAVSAARDAAHTATATHRLKHVGLAFHNYHSAYKQLPTAAATDGQGNLIWSWRVTLLPFVEHVATWDQWQKDQEWDSAANAALAVPLPYVYASPKEANPASDQTHVFTVRDTRSAMSGERGLSFQDITDGLANTILAVYLPGRTASWAAPDDVSLAELQIEFAKATPKDPILVLFADGAVKRFSEPLDPATVEALVTRDAGDVADFVPGF